jgi:ankyrin repeat protein
LKGCDPPTPDGVVIRSPQKSPSPIFPTSRLLVENIPWHLFKRDLQSRVVLPQDMSATQDVSSKLTVIPSSEQHFRLLSSAPTGDYSAELPKAAISSSHDVILEPIDLFNPNLDDWIFENDITRSLLLDIAVSQASLGTNQAGLMTRPSSEVKISHEYALSFFSELSFMGIIPKMSTVRELTTFLGRYTVDDDDLELSTSSGTLGMPTDFLALYRLFSLFIFLISNNMVTLSDIDKILRWIVTNNCAWMITNILKLSSTTVDVFATRIFPAAVQAGEIDLVRKLICRGIDANSSVSGLYWGKPESPVSLAVRSRDLKMVELLCASGATLEVFRTSVIRTEQDHVSLWSSSNTKLLSLLLKLGADPETFVADEPRGFPLISAASEGEVEAVRLLLNAQAQPNWAVPDFGSALQAAAARGHEVVARALIERGASVNTTGIIAIPHHYGYNFWPQGYAAFKTPIQLASSGDHIEIVQILLQSGALVNYSPSVMCLGLPRVEEIFSRWSRHSHYEEIPLAYAIQYAALNQNVILLQQLLAAGANADSRIGTNYGDTPLQTAARLGHVVMTRILLCHKANPNAPAGKYKGRTAIQAAAGSGNLEVLGLLLDAKADINAGWGWIGGRTAVQAAMEGGHQAAVDILLKSGADINAAPAFSEGVTALQAAAIFADMGIFQMALQYGAHINAPAGPVNGITALQAVIKHKNLTSLKVVLQAGADVNGRPSKASESCSLFDRYEASNKTPLQYAVYLGWLDGVQCLLDWGSDIDALPPHPEFEAYSALGCAISNGDEDAIRLLLRNGADPNAPANNDEFAPSAFILALSRDCSYESLNLFLQKNADITRCWGTESALEVAVSGDVADVVEMVINVMSQIPGYQYQNAVKRSLAFVTVDVDWPPNFNIVKLLVQAGADINAIDSETGMTLLHRSIGEGGLDTIKFLLEHGAEVNIPATEKRGTPLQDAILNQEVEIAQLLLEYGADINAPPSEKQGATALQAAALHGYYSLVLRLLGDGADISAAPSAISGRTAIDGAAEHGRLDILQLLLNAYGDQSDLALICSHAASVAENKGHIGVANWLRTYAGSSYPMGF